MCDKKYSATALVKEKRMNVCIQFFHILVDTLLWSKWFTMTLTLSPSSGSITYAAFIFLF